MAESIDKEIYQLAVDTSEEVRKTMEFPNYINGEEIEDIYKALMKVKTGTNT